MVCKDHRRREPGRPATPGGGAQHARRPIPGRVGWESKFQFSLTLLRRRSSFHALLQLSCTTTVPPRRRLTILDAPLTTSARPVINKERSILPQSGNRTLRLYPCRARLRSSSDHVPGIITLAPPLRSRGPAALRPSLMTPARNSSALQPRPRPPARLVVLEPAKGRRREWSSANMA